MKDLHKEKLKTLKKEIEQDTRRWKDPLSLWISKIKIMKMVTLQYPIYIFQCNIIETTKQFFTEIKIMLLHWIGKQKRYLKHPWNRRNCWSITISDSKLCYRGVIVETAWYRHIGYRTYDHLTFDKESNNTYRGKENVNKWCCSNWLGICRRIRTGSYLSSIQNLDQGQ